MSSSTGQSPEGTSQFWDDFWNTIYQFTHPFSSSFFDSLLNGDESDTAGSGSSPSSQPVGSAGKGSPSNEATESQGSGTYRFKDRPSFEKFWNDMKKSADGHDSSPSTLLEHIQEAWTDAKTTATGFISSVLLHAIYALLSHFGMITPNPLAAMLFCTILLAALSEPLNGIGSRHWREFSDDNYFDSYGVFTSLVWSAPLLGNAILAVLLLLRATAGLLIKVKKAQIQESKRKKQK
ncbi:hypothetical protein BGZ80_008686 [Entomortierella chlamydospora]|uniref:Transmembrane protein 18 n=1 Tax=Entomortierella chlamydospora TaxID=101097 RepID=A0A9P6N398_9FUNG|nr:hypothetical protein BGZ80_008686 [Entomortierella chlamydospora]